MFNAKIQNNFITPEDSKWIIDVVSNIEPWESGYGSDFWDNRSLNAQKIYNDYDKQIGQYLFNLRSKIKSTIIKMYNLEDDIYPDLTQVIRWFPGMEQPPHADDMSNIEEYGPNRHRDFGAIIYLNDNYSGGHTYYPQYNIEVKPEIGKLAVHPGDTNHFHGVTKIDKNIRYTIVSFWTFNKSFYDNWKLDKNPLN